MTPMMLVRTPNTFAKNSGKRCTSISLATSRRKLVRDNAQMLRGRERKGGGEEGERVGG